MRAHRRFLLPGAALAAALAPAAPADAVYTVSYTASSGLQVTGDGGADGAAVFFIPEDGAYRVRPESRPGIPGATQVAGPGCVLQADGAVTCAVTASRVITANLGAGNDALSGILAKLNGDMFVSGGAGDDVLFGSVGLDAIDGGPGADTLQGGDANDVVEGGDGDDVLLADSGQSAAGGSDTLRGEAGNDTFRAGSSNVFPDRLEGGTGVDRADYSRRTTRVDLKVTYGGVATADDGAVGEGDAIGSDVEVLIGGSAADQLIADRGTGSTAVPTQIDLIGNGGGDRILARAAITASIDPGLGGDAVQGSSLTDRIFARDGERDKIDCGGGIDALIADLRDSPISATCEDVDQGAVKEGPNVHVLSKSLRVGAGGRVAVRLRCPAPLKSSCSGSLTTRVARAGSASGPRTRYRLRPGRSTTVRVTLPAGQRAAARRPGARLLVRSVERGTHGARTTVRSLRVQR